jgi:D-Tyr-tRNAtyr deacylase
VNNASTAIPYSKLLKRIARLRRLADSARSDVDEFSKLRADYFVVSQFRLMMIRPKFD